MKKIASSCPGTLHAFRTYRLSHRLFDRLLCSARKSTSTTAKPVDPAPSRSTLFRDQTLFAAYRRVLRVSHRRDSSQAQMLCITGSGRSCGSYFFWRSIKRASNPKFLSSPAHGHAPGIPASLTRIRNPPRIASEIRVQPWRRVCIRRASSDDDAQPQVQAQAAAAVTAEVVGGAPAASSRLTGRADGMLGDHSSFGTSARSRVSASSIKRNPLVDQCHVHFRCTKHN